MDLHPSEDQEAMRAAAADWWADALPLAAARERDPAAVWAGLSELGLVAMTASEADGGLALGHDTEALVAAELGRFLAPLALVSTAVAARWWGLRGKVALGLPTDSGWRLLDPEGATQALVIGPEGLGVAPLPAGEGARPSLDLTTAQRLADHLSVDAVGRPGAAGAADHLRLLSAAYALGAADAARDMAVAYACVREQFGQPIGAFQAIKHLCADMAVLCAVARSQLFYAACAMDAADPDAALHVACAKRLADDAAIANTRGNIQVHGGIGMTDEAAPHLLLKRAHLLAFISPVVTADLLADVA